MKLDNRAPSAQSGVILVKLLLRRLALLLLTLTAVAQSATHGQFSRNAIPVWDRLWNAAGEAQTVQIPARDGIHTLLARYIEQKDNSGVELSLLKGTRRLWKTQINLGVGIEISWSPDSQAFFVTSSNAGRGGWFGASAYFLKGDDVSSLDLSPTILASIGHPFKCSWDEDPNVVGIRWSESSSRLVLAAEIVWHSNCDSYGTFRAYEVALPDGKILKTWDQIEFKRLFRSDLGWELRGAPDRCIWKPQSCWVPDNHRDTR